jgi:hypothetical protein
MEAQAELTTVRQRLEQQIVANATMLGGLIDDSTTKLGCGTHHPQAPACLPACWPSAACVRRLLLLVQSRWTLRAQLRPCSTDLSALHHTVDVEVASKLQSLDVECWCWR